jgi:hypothetical protein
MTAMGGARSFRNEQFDGLAQQVLTRIPKHALGLPVDERNAPFAIHRQERIRRQLDDIAERMLVSGLCAVALVSLNA